MEIEYKIVVFFFRENIVYFVDWKVDLFYYYNKSVFQDF